MPKTWTDTLETVVLQVRLPRILASVLVGAALAACGAAYHNAFQNPLEIPLGILTALIGAPFFIVLLARTAKA